MVRVMVRCLAKAVGVFPEGHILANCKVQV